MKLYAFQPQSYGSYSFFVMAESEEKARESINQQVKNIRNEEDFGSEDQIEQWLKYNDSYHLTVLEAGQVITNLNE